MAEKAGYTNVKVYVEGIPAWKKARHFGEKYWLYIVTEAATRNPKLDKIQHPSMHFTEGEDIIVTGFMIPEDRWKGNITIT